MNAFESVGASVRRVALWSLCAGFACGAWAAWADGEAAERFVKIDGDNAADGLTWDTAWRTIQYAVDNSPSGATITVGPGEYGISVAKAVGVQMWALNLTNSVRIVSSEGPAATIIDAARSDTADTITSPRAEVRCTAANAALCGFTIRGGSGSSKGNTSGVAFSGKDSVLSNCTISISSQWGGSIVAFSGGAKGFDLKFTGYSLSEYGYILNLSGAGTVVDRFAWKGQNWVRLYSPITVSGGAILRNALIANITNSANYATVNVSGSGSRIESCTVAGCRSTGSASPFQCDAAAIVTNSIIAHNEVTLASYANIQGNANLNRFFSCCCPQLPEGERGNVAGDPQFVGAADYRLLVQSPCVNASPVPAAEDPLSGTVDLDGNPRVFAGSLDMGCFECQQDPSEAPLIVTFNVVAGARSESGKPVEATFRGASVGSVDGLTATWDFGDGSDPVVGWPEVTHTYTVPGLYTVTVSATNGKGETSAYAVADGVTVVPAACYVNKTGSGTYPYDTPEKGTADFNAAFAVKPGEIVVGDGTFTATGGSTELIVGWSVYVHSENGANRTTLRTTSHWNFKVTADAGDGARISGFTLSGGGTGSAYGIAGALDMACGTVDHCVVSNVAVLSRSCICALSGTAKMTDCTVDGAGWRNDNKDGGPMCAINLSGQALAERVEVKRFTAPESSVGHCAVYVNSADAVLRNAYVHDNTRALTPQNANNARGAGVRLVSGRVENCTIVDNTAGGFGGGLLVEKQSGTVVNTIVANNVSKLDADTSDVYAPSAPSTTFDHCSAANLANVTAFPAGMGEGCTIIAPVFDSERPHRLKSASAPQIDSGVALDWMTDDAVDLDGMPRVRFDGVDMGCFELQEKQVIPLGGSVSVTQSTGRYPFETTFVPALVGDQKGVEGTWSFGDGASVAYSGESVSHVYERPGQYAVTLSIANEAGETAELAVSTAIIVVGETCRVSANGTSVAPYLTWETAATNLQDAVALRPDTVLVTNGTFTLRDSGMVLDRPVVVKSVNGPAVTTIDGEGQHRIATISDDGVLLEGFTLMRGHCTDWQGQFVNMTCGELRNCILTNATKGLDRDRFIVASGTARLTDLRMWFGTEVGSGNGDNSCLWGVLLSGQATADRCLFDHWQLKRNHVNAQAALSVSGKAAVRNSLIRDCLYAAKNWQDNAENACIVNLSGGGTLENCTMVHCEVQPKSSNTKQRLPVYLGTSGKVINCVFSGNRDEFGTEHDFAGSTDGVSFSRSVDLVAGVRGNVSADPCFKNAVRGNFRPRASSPIIDAGTNLVWTAAADAVDLDGCRRCVNKTVDMGCYEHQWSGFTLIVK